MQLVVFNFLEIENAILLHISTLYWIYNDSNHNIIDKMIKMIMFNFYDKNNCLKDNKTQTKLIYMGFFK